MKIVIIEDERLSAEDLAESILSAIPSTNITATLQSVKEAIGYFKENPAPDLIFSDIQLGDGLSFEIFKSLHITTPVIFCTAYDEYALNAFKANGIDYIVKPYTQKNINDALAKFQELKKSFSPNLQYDTILELFENSKNNRQTSVLVHYKDKILPIRIEDVAIFYIENEITHLRTFDNKVYSINENLGDLEKNTGPQFYRVDRQHLINRKAVKDVSQYFSRKLNINFNVPFSEIVSIRKAKVTEFLQWLSNR